MPQKEPLLRPLHSILHGRARDGTIIPAHAGVSVPEDSALETLGRCQGLGVRHLWDDLGRAEHIPDLKKDLLS